MAVDFKDHDRIGVLTLNEPARHNAMSTRLVTGMLAALAESRTQRSRALVITGTAPAFCAGADIGDLLKAGWMAGTATGPTPVDVFRALESEPRIVIAAVGGPALGGGFELVLNCDLVLASPSASFMLPEINHGVVPNTALAKLAALIGARKALEMVLTRRRIGAQEALALGLVNGVVPQAALLDGAVALAREIVDGAPPGALATAKASFWRHQSADWPEVQDCIARLPADEWREGLSAFLERRKPDYEPFWNRT